MLYCYLDESGTPGISKTANEYLSLALVIFDSLKASEKAAMQIQDLQKKLHFPDNFEFHLIDNAKATREAFLETISQLDFRYIFISINRSRSHFHASYKNLVKLLLDELDELGGEFSIRMDSNPTLYAELRQQSKMCRMKLRCREVRSQSFEQVQIADYVVGLATRELKGRKVSSKWRQIKKKDITLKKEKYERPSH